MKANVKPAPKNVKTSTKTTAPLDSVPTKPKGSRGTVFVQKTPSQLRALIGENTPILVSNKDLKRIYVAKKTADIDAELS